MTEYIEREAVLAEYDRQHKGEPGGARKIIAEFPSADVVLRDCYNAILWENDVMRKQLAEIGKGFGQKMNDVAPVVRGRWKRVDPRSTVVTFRCSECNYYAHMIATNFCPNCGADMREINNG